MVSIGRVCAPWPSGEAGHDHLQSRWLAEYRDQASRMCGGTQSVSAPGQIEWLPCHEQAGSSAVRTTGALPVRCRQLRMYDAVQIAPGPTAKLIADDAESAGAWTRRTSRSPASGSAYTAQSIVTATPSTFCTAQHCMPRRSPSTSAAPTSHCHYRNRDDAHAQEGAARLPQKTSHVRSSPVLLYGILIGDRRRAFADPYALLQQSQAVTPKSRCLLFALKDDPIQASVCPRCLHDVGNGTGHFGVCGPAANSRRLIR